MLNVLFKFHCKKKKTLKNNFQSAIMLTVERPDVSNDFAFMSRSTEILRRAARKIPGGVNSPVRAWKAVGGNPVIINRGKGSYVFDADGKRYIDLVGSWGPLILGHAHPQIVKVRKQRAIQGFTFRA